MTLSRGLARMGVAVAVLASVLLLGLAVSTTAQAQSPPFTAYGAAANSITAGDTVEAFIGGVSCGSATADSNGEWVLEVGESAACAPSAGDTISFTLNGAAVDETATWSAGGVPTDVANGLTLTVSSAPPAATMTPAPTTPVPTPPETGNAGLVGASQGSSPWLALSLGALALVALLGGARALTRRVR